MAPTKQQSAALALLAKLGLSTDVTTAKVGGGRRTNPPLDKNEGEILDALNVAVLNVPNVSYVIPGNIIDNDKAGSIRDWFRQHGGFAAVNPTTGTPQRAGERYLSVRRQKGGNGTILETVFRATGKAPAPKKAPKS